MNYEIRTMQPEDGEKVISIFQEGINGGNATFDQTAPVWEAWDHKFVWDFFNDNVADLSPQLPLYYAGLSMLGYPHATVRYNEIRYRATAQIKADPISRINRPAPRITPQRVLTTMEEHIQIGQRIFDLRQLGLDEWEKRVVRTANNQTCKNCDFAKMCIGELNGEDRNQFYVGVDILSVRDERGLNCE